MIRIHSRRGGFTLIELLVVLAIIALLASILIPTLRGAMENGKRTSCRAKLKDIGTALQQFADDHEGWYVWGAVKASTDVADGSMNQQWPFMEHCKRLNAGNYITDPSVWVCPSDRFDGPGDDVPVFPAKAFDEFFNGFQNISYMQVCGYNRKSDEMPSSAPLMADESNEQENGAATPGVMPDIDANDNHGADFRNVLYLDGHVAGLQGNDVANSIFDAVRHPERLQSVD